MKKLIFVSLATFLAIALFLAGPLSAQDVIVKMLEPIPDEAIKAVLTKYPNDAQIHLGAAYLVLDPVPFEFRPPSSFAQEVREKAIKLAPAHKKIFLIQDLKRISYKKYDEEDLKRLEELVKIDPGNVWPHYLLAGYYLKKGQKEKWLREVDEALAKERFDDYEVERLRAIFRVLDEINPSLKAVRKMSIFYGTPLPELSITRKSAGELIKMGKELEEKGEREKALEYYRKAERIGLQLVITTRPRLYITRLVSISIRKTAYPEMARFYEEEGQKKEAAVLREQIDLMDAALKGLRAITTRKTEEVINLPPWGMMPPWEANALFDVRWEEIRPEKHEEIKTKQEHLKENIRKVLNSPEYTQMMDTFWENSLTKGQIEAYKSLPEPEKSPIAEYREQLGKKFEDLQLTIAQSLSPAGIREKCRQNMKRIGLALLLYAHDYKTSFFPPPEVGLKVLVPEYISEAILYKCPYEYTPHQVKVTASRTTPLVWDKQGNHPGGRNVVFVDGHAEWMPEEEFQKRLAEQKGK